MRAARSPGATVAGVLVEMGAITEEQLAHARAERHGLLYVDLDAYEVDPSRGQPPDARCRAPARAAFRSGSPGPAWCSPWPIRPTRTAPATSRRWPAGRSCPPSPPRPRSTQLIERLPLPQPAGELEVGGAKPPAEEAETEAEPEARRVPDRAAGRRPTRRSTSCGRGSRRPRRSSTRRACARASTTASSPRRGWRSRPGPWSWRCCARSSPTRSPTPSGRARRPSTRRTRSARCERAWTPRSGAGGCSRSASRS